MSKLNWKKVIGWGVAALVVIGVVGYNTWKTKQTQAIQQKPNVLVMAHITGAGAASDALKKALDGFRKQNPDLSFNWITVDTQAMPSVAVSALHQKLALQNVDLIVAFIDAIIDPMLPIADEKGIPVLGLFCEIQNNPKNFKNIQYFSTKESDIFEPMGRFLKQKASKIAVLYTADTYGDSGFKTLKKEYFDNEHKIVFSDSYALQDFNVRELVQKTLSYKPDAVAVIGYGAGYENIFRMLKQYEFDGLVVSDTVAARLDTYNRLDGALEGVYMPFAKIVDKEKFNKTNLNSYPDLIVFDAMTYVNEAFKKGIPFTRDEFQKMKKYENITTVNFLENGHSNQDVQMGVWKNGELVPVTE